MIRARSQGREAALQALYQLDLRDDAGDDDVEALVDTSSELTLDDARAFAIELVRGVREHMQTLDVELETVAINWKLGRMAVIDRNILRLGAYELRHRADIPPAVSINEAINLAKKFSTKESGGFVNGILDKIHQRLGEEARG